MPIATFSASALLASCDAAFPSVGSIGYLTLLSGNLTTGLGYAVDAATNRLTTATAHGLVTGSRVQMVDGVLPTPLLANTDYYAIVVSLTVLELGATLEDAQAAIAIDFTDIGSGTLTLSEQPLSAADPLSVLVNKEIAHPAWLARAAIDNAGVATMVSGAAQKPAIAVAIDNTSATDLEYLHYLLIQSPAAGMLGSAPTGAGYILSSEPAVQSIASGSARPLVMRLRVRNA